MLAGPVTTKPDGNALALADVRKQFGETTVLKGIDLAAEDGELVVLVGPSGCGKSTLLRCLAGLETPDHGTIRIGERDVTRLPPKERDVAMVFQSYALYPHLTVRRNLAFGLELRKTPARTIDKRVTEVAGMLGLEALLDRYPRELSGGQRQRVAMGRAIARRPSLFLFDEPLSNLDAALRTEVRIEIKRLHHQLRTTMVYVTHDQEEAMTLADRLVVLNGGVVEQQGPAIDVYREPATRFVGSFLGSPAMSFLPAEAKEGTLTVGDATFDSESAHRGPCTVGLRTHDVVVDPDGPLTLEVRVVETLGHATHAHGVVEGHPFVARLHGDQRPAPGDEVRLRPVYVHLFDPESGARIRR
ncbi:MAG: sn-glycerol-3-phosphate ABC transporter ATP-binding protein UgpC [Deltaproteobacteria bacterium]|nr:sn-glycerol-3-phosphate ABC transporter ATP-binding protein UgpC [Deltaproteobacteria bacterium]